MQFNDQQALAFVLGQAYAVNTRVYETRYPDWDFGRLVYVDTTGPEWSPGILTYTSDMSGRANWQSGYAKDVPLADVSADRTPRNFHLAAIGYQWNLEEVNSALAVPGASLSDRRARAARLAYTKFLFDLTVKGSAEKGMGGLINYAGVTITNAPADGTAGSTLWVNAAGVGQKTPAQIVRDINIALQGIFISTYESELADTLLLPIEAYNYIAGTPYSATTMETILSFVQRTNIYTQQTGRPLTIRTVRELSTGAANGTTGRMVAYRNGEEYVKLLLPMPHRFLNVWQDGPMNYVVPGIFRTGGIDVLTTAAMRYIDQISEPATV